MIQFILNHFLVQLNTIQADTTLLDYLRLQADLKGSKEGCASGDCGACTIVIASLDKQGTALEYKTLNSCICLLGSLHGKQIITVDGLKDKAGNLHPVQQAMVAYHASQCGFCTPGFVMSIFAMAKQSTNRDTEKNKVLRRDNVINSLDGNLCRCTGYRPIIDAAESVLDNFSTDHFDHNHDETVRILNVIKSASVDNFLIPETLAELSQLIEANPEAKLLAGGTDLALNVTQALQKIDKIIYLSKIDALQAIAIDKYKIMIGSAATYEKSATVLMNEYPALKDHLNRLGSLQIRNVATIGGNIANASPIADMPPVLMALDSQLTLQKGDRIRKVSMDDFYTGYKQTIMQEGEFIRDIHIPRFQAGHYFTVYKITKRHADDISAVCAAFYLHLKEGKVLSARIAFGGMAATVKRASNCEKVLVNQFVNNETLEKAMSAILSDFNPLDDVRSSQKYRLKMAENSLKRLFIELRSVG